MRVSARLTTVFIGLILCAQQPAACQTLPVAPADIADSTAIARTLPRIAEQILGSYREADNERRLDNLFRLQTVAGHYADAVGTLTQLRAMRTTGPRAKADAAASTVPYEVFAKAKVIEASDGRPFAQALTQAFRETMRGLDDRTAALATRAFAANAAAMQNNFRNRIDALKETSISTAAGVALTRSYLAATTFRSFSALVGPLIDEDDNRRYIIERDIQVRTAHNATVCALVVRPRNASARLPALLEFTIYNDPAATLREARRSASNGYVGVSGLTRGKGCSANAPVPYVNEATDVPALIDWISVQPWSDGRVGMFGGSYSGFTAWSATKHMPKALKAIMVGAPVAPGIDVPMEGNIAWNFIYQWPFYTTNNKTLDDATYFDNNRWFNMNRSWYVNGRPYRDLEKIDGTPNPIFNEWIAHPAYDKFWQDMIPYGPEFGAVRIPVLQTAGYFYGGPGAATYYLTQHYKYNPNAEHYLVIGPYDHVPAQRGVVSALGDTTTSLNGYETDPVARIDIGADLRYQWFDYVLRGKPRPPLLEDKVNYQVMGANIWRHAPSIAAMSNGVLRLHMTAVRSPLGGYKLSRAAGPASAGATQTMQLKNRADVDRIGPGGGLMDVAVDTVDAVEYTSDPIETPTELSGLFNGHFEIVTNRKDFDFVVALYELTPGGNYFQLPPFQSRASHVADLATRHLLTPGKRTTLDFRSVRLVSRKLAKGSRIVMIVGVIKSTGMQINYGTGKSVSDESIADAGEPLTVKWFANSYVDLPIRR